MSGQTATGHPSATPTLTIVNTADPVPAPVVDLEAIIAEPGPLTIAGIECTVRRIRTREALALLRLVAPALSELQSVALDDVAQATKVLGGALLAAAANWPDEFLAFVQTIVDPVDPDRRNALLVELSNPDLDALLGVADTLVAQEAADIVGLVGKVQALAARARTTTATTPTDGPAAPGLAPST